jgi:hypothetical protein
MAKSLTKEQWLARAEAYDEAAEHLGQSWTDDAEERTQGDVVARRRGFGSGLGKEPLRATRWASIRCLSRWRSCCGCASNLN